MRSTTKQLVALSLAIGGVAAAAPNLVEAKGFMPKTLDYGFFYGTLDESLNTAVFAGGTFEEFCASDPDGGPANVPLRVFPRSDGSVDLKVNAKDQRIYLYETEFNGIPAWLDATCPGIMRPVDGDEPPKPFAEGHADLKVRISDQMNGTVEVFNSVNGKATGTDGTQYKVRGSADLVLKGDVPQGDPRDFVDFTLKEIRRR